MWPFSRNCGDDWFHCKHWKGNYQVEDDKHPGYTKWVQRSKCCQCKLVFDKDGYT